jgi:hypothetical protein
MLFIKRFLKHLGLFCLDCPRTNSPNRERNVVAARISLLRKRGSNRCNVLISYWISYLGLFLGFVLYSADIKSLSSIGFVSPPSLPKCYMGLRPTNAHESPSHLFIPGSERSEESSFSVPLQRSRFFVASLLRMTGLVASKTGGLVPRFTNTITYRRPRNEARQGRSLRLASGKVCVRLCEGGLRPQCPIHRSPAF